jgi:putative PIG3 family NAD(P)H quinone oxidoreductase
MRYIDLPEFGQPQVMQLRQGDAPVPTASEVLIRVSAAGVNRPDVIQRQGLYPAPPGASPILGLEVSGVITAVGDEVDQWHIGDRVCALVNGGGYAEYAVAPAAQCLPIPAGLDMVAAAALPETFFTVWSNVVQRCALQAGENFLVHGGASGIGTTAIQIASALGATVYTTVGSDEKARACEALGATLAINYRKQDFYPALKQKLGQRGIDVTLDMVGGDYIEKNIKLAALEGRIAHIAFLQGSVASVNFMPVMLKRLTLTGSTLRPQSAAYKAEIARQLADRIWPLLASGRIKPVLAACFELEQVADAHTLMESNQTIGKIVLQLGDEG